MIEDNKLLAEFLGYQNTTPNDKDFDIYELKGKPLIEAMSMKFHSDWNWLMSVVDKIEGLGSCQIDISSNWCRIGYKDTKFNYDSRNHFKVTKKEAVYLACVEFIKWYNKEQKI